MAIERLKFIAATAAGGAIIAAAVVVAVEQPAPHQYLAGGSGDSATGTTYTQPSVKGMSLGSTATSSPVKTNEAAPTALATEEASPTYKATAAPGCVNNGQCP